MGHTIFIVNVVLCIYRCKRVFTEEPKSVPIASKKVEQKKKEPEKTILEKQK